MRVESIHMFENAVDARTYRHENGTGGWIFDPEHGGPTYLFPPGLPPIRIFNHELTHGKTGQLIGAA